MKILFRHFKDVVRRVGSSASEPVLVVIEDLVGALADHAQQPVVHGAVTTEHDALNRTAARFNNDTFISALLL